MATNPTDFDSFFHEATGNSPYPYQRRLAESPLNSCLVDIPTGLGKTAAAILAWLWQRRFEPHADVRTSTPRRLVYCLPMRVVVEARVNDGRWLNRLKLPGKERVGEPSQSSIPHLRAAAAEQRAS